MYDDEIWVSFSDRIKCYTHGQTFILVVFFLWCCFCGFVVVSFLLVMMHTVLMCVMYCCDVRGGRVRGTCKKSSLVSKVKILETKYRKMAHTNKHIPKPVCDPEDVIVLMNPAVHTDREVTTNRQIIII